MAEIIGSPTAYPVSWDGGAISALAFSSITIWCTAAPTVAPTIQTSSDGVQWDAQGAVTGNLAGVVTAIATTGRYDMSGNCFIRLTGGTGGAYLLGGSN
jgi:S1-C subfamily serine protease